MQIIVDRFYKRNNKLSPLYNNANYIISCVLHIYCYLLCSIIYHRHRATMDQETARLMFEEGGTLVLLGMPYGTEFGIDMNSWNIAEKFKGVKMIPPGLHFIYYRFVLCFYLLVFPFASFCRSVLFSFHLQLSFCSSFSYFDWMLNGVGKYESMKSKANKGT